MYRQCFIRGNFFYTRRKYKIFRCGENIKIFRCGENVLSAQKMFYTWKILFLSAGGCLHMEEMFYAGRKVLSTEKMYVIHAKIMF